MGDIVFTARDWHFLVFCVIYGTLFLCGQIFLQVLELSNHLTESLLLLRETAVTQQHLNALLHFTVLVHVVVLELANVRLGAQSS